jgi:hypothetical protein
MIYNCIGFGPKLTKLWISKHHEVKRWPQNARGHNSKTVGRIWLKISESYFLAKIDPGTKFQENLRRGGVIFIFFSLISPGITHEYVWTVRENIANFIFCSGVWTLPCSSSSFLLFIEGIPYFQGTCCCPLN